MIIEHAPDRRTTITFDDAGITYRATWTQPYNYSILPVDIRDIVLGCRRADSEQSYMMRYLEFNYKLSVQRLTSN